MSWEQDLNIAHEQRDTTAPPVIEPEILMPLEVFKGKMADFRSEETWVPTGYFYRTAKELESDRNISGIFAAVASAIGDSGLAAINNHASNLTTKVTAVGFVMGENIFLGYLNDCPFGPEDEVEVVAQRKQASSQCVVKAIARPLDRLITLPPGYVRGRRAYFLRARKRWAATTLILSTLIMALDVQILNKASDWSVFIGIPLCVAAFYAFIEYRLYVDNTQPIVHETEKILSTLGLAETQSVDLVNTSKTTRRGNEPTGYRWKFYRY